MKSIQLYDVSKVYIACPPNFASGGPELLHQLAFNLRKLFDIEVFMLYYPYTENPVHPEYALYKIPYTYHVEDDNNNILIVPEIKLSLNFLTKYKNIRKGVWFLSIDNYYLSRVKKTDFFLKKLINKIYRSFSGNNLYELNYEDLVEKYPISKDEKLKLADFFLTNSFRGYLYLESKGLSPLFYLSEYLNEDFLKSQTNLPHKQDIVIYNPQKGYSFTKKIIKRTKGIEFVPIINMTRQQVVETLQKAKVYIDFGNHPGKDRIPREAAILGCCVITGKRGSAAFYEDVPIPEEYKFDERDENIPEIINKIRDCFENFDERYKDFDHYREVIKQEPQKFVEDLKKIFVKVE
jgi:hypothetical protein